MPEGAVYVGRPTKWGNPFKVGEMSPYGTIIEDKRHAASIFGGFAPINEKLVAAARAELRGKDLACWCRLDEKCHADILLEIANSDEDCSDLDSLKSSVRRMTATP
jgi:hypothetical protein